MECYGYLYAYFRRAEAGGDLQHVYFALSRDGLHFSPLNGNRPVLGSTLGTRGVRDPHLVRSQLDGSFYLLGTDLDANGGDWPRYVAAGSRHMVVWQSGNLVDWQPQRMVPFVDGSIGCVWAPKACFDAQRQEYVVFFSGSAAGTPDIAIWYCRTQDFACFTPPKLLLDKRPNTTGERYSEQEPAPEWVSFIDSTTVPVEGMYYRFTKNEVSKTIQCEKSRHILEGFTLVKEWVAGERGVEGPCVYRLQGQDRWILLLDGYLGPNRGVGYFPLAATTRQLQQGIFTRLGLQQYSLPEGCKHGSVLAVTQKEYESLVAAYHI